MTDRLCEVSDCVYVSSCGTASDENILKGHGITHIVDATFEAGGTISEENRGNRVVLRLQLKDRPDENITRVLPRAIYFVEVAVRNGGRVLIYCEKGVSRSGAIAVAYIMKTRNVDVNEALRLARLSRPEISPNSGFIANLTGWYQAGMYMGSYDAPFSALLSQKPHMPPS